MHVPWQKNGDSPNRFITDDTDSDTHPNTVDIRVTCLNGRTYSVRGEIPWVGGKVRISRIDHIDVDFSGEYSTLIIIHHDRLGVLAHITRCLSEGYVNIAFMKLFRETKGDTAYSIIEFDGSLRTIWYHGFTKTRMYRMLCLYR